MAFGDFARVLVPPKDSKEGPGVTTWRWSIVVIVVFLAVNGAAGRGWIWGGYGAYAASKDVKTILELQFAEELRNLQKEKCDKPVSERGTLDRVIEDYQRRFYELTGTRYPLPPCKDDG